MVYREHNTTYIYLRMYVAPYILCLTWNTHNRHTSVCCTYVRIYNCVLYTLYSIHYTQCAALYSLMSLWFNVLWSKLIITLVCCTSIFSPWIFLLLLRLRFHSVWIQFRCLLFVSFVPIGKMDSRTYQMNCNREILCPPKGQLFFLPFFSFFQQCFSLSQKHFFRHSDSNRPKIIWYAQLKRQRNSNGDEDGLIVAQLINFWNRKCKFTIFCLAKHSENDEERRH